MAPPKKEKPQRVKIELSKTDPHTFSNPEQVYVEKYEIKWQVYFSAQILRGYVVYALKRRDKEAKHIIFDTQGLKILDIRDKLGQKLEFAWGYKISPFGTPLQIKLPHLDKKETAFIRIDYETSGSTSLQWVPPQLTFGKTHPYMYSQGQSINNRSLLPCQDTPSTKAPYSADVIVPTDFTVVMSAIRTGGGPRHIGGTHKLYSFEQNIAIPSYLIAIAVGHLDYIQVGPRSRVYAEPGLVKQAGFEFGEVEFLIRIAEKFCGDYVWGPYDLVVMPLSYPYGATENPCATFVTPTLIVGDRSLAHVIAHEVAHSWTGNMVTCKNFEHLWLNEGFAIFFERRIIGLIMGEQYRSLLAMIGWKDMTDEINSLGADNPLTCMVPDLSGIHPDDGCNIIPYEKGCVFINYLVEVVGGLSAFEAFFQHYRNRFQFKSIDSDKFKATFILYFQTQGIGDRIREIDWDTWFFSPGMPLYTPKFDDTLLIPCTELRDRWLQWDPSTSSNFSSEDLQAFTSTFQTSQMIQFLSLLLEDPNPFPAEKAMAMEKAYEMNKILIIAIRGRWLRLCVKAQWKMQLEFVADFLAKQGLAGYNKPIYHELYNWKEMRPFAIELFKKLAPGMMKGVRDEIAKVLYLSVMK